MRTAHNAFIGALAMSDLMLCTVTLPINLWEMFNEKWIFGEQSQILCGFTMAAQKFPILQHGGWGAPHLPPVPKKKIKKI